MLTRFSPQQLADPQLKACNEVLRACVHCGFCNATCPTYLLLGDELDGPRGRIYLMQRMLESNESPSKETVKHIDRCLGCLSCMSTCPSGVNYLQLLDHARAYIEQRHQRPWPQGLIRALLPRVLASRRLLRSLLRLSSALRPLTPLLPRSLRTSLQLTPRALPPAGECESDHLWSCPNPRGRVALLAGCVQSVLAPQINAAAIRLLNRAGFEVITAGQARCCGALAQHMGQEQLALAAARRTLQAWSEQAQQHSLDAIVVTTSGCGTALKNYGRLFAQDPACAATAARIAMLVRDITEFLPDRLFERSPWAQSLTVGYHPACSLQHGQGLRGTGERLLEAAGFSVRVIPESHLCCGSAGTYNLLQPQLAGQLLARKLTQVQRIAPDVIATGNIGCIVQLASGTDIPVVHTVELLDWASGGPPPAAIAERREKRGAVVVTKHPLNQALSASER